MMEIGEFRPSQKEGPNNGPSDLSGLPSSILQFIQLNGGGGTMMGEWPKGNGTAHQRERRQARKAQCEGPA
jgi:hypothetical protein